MRLLEQKRKAASAGLYVFSSDRVSVLTLGRRSTKGASKARRDHINAEIRTLRSLLPISAEDQERLSYLHSMSLICTFIRKSVLLSGSGRALDPSGASPLNQSSLQALPGFIVALTRDGKLVYVSENVQEYLGLSMVRELPVLFCFTRTHIYPSLYSGMIMINLTHA